MCVGSISVGIEMNQRVYDSHGASPTLMAHNSIDTIAKIMDHEDI